MGIGSYQSIADAAALKYGVPASLLSWQLNQESGWNPNATNGGAMGIAQLDQAQMNRFGGGSPYDPAAAIPVAAQIDAALYAKSGSWSNVLETYGTTYKVPQSVTDSANAMLAGLGGAVTTDTGAGSTGSDGGGDPCAQYSWGTAEGVNCRANQATLGYVGITSPAYSGPDLSGTASVTGVAKAARGESGATGTSAAVGTAIAGLTSAGTWQRVGLVVMGFIVLVFVLVGLTRGQK